MSLKKSGRDYLRDTQPEVWKTSYDMSSMLAAELIDKKWRERAFLLDAFICDLVTEMMGADGLIELAQRPIAELLPEDDESTQEVAQLVASVRAILTAALLDLPAEEKDKVDDIETPEHSLVLLLSELHDHQDAGRAWTAAKGIDLVLEALKPLAGITTLLLADRSSSNSIEALTSAEKLRQLVQDFWGEEPTVH